MNAQTQTDIQRAIGDLQTLREQWSGVESIDKEREKAEAKLAAAKQNVVAMRAEFNEVKRAHDDILKKALAKQSELEKLDAELKRKSKRLADINAALSGFPELERRIERLDAEFRGKAGEVSNLIGELLKTLREHQGG